jgi:hypothetical protein
MKIRRFFSRVYRKPLDGDGSDEGSGPVVDSAPAVDTAAPADTSAPAEADKPASAHEAMWGKPSGDPLPGETAEATAARLRDEQGRFAKKPEGEQPLVPPKPGEAPKKPEAVNPLHVMPEGLSPKGQERFQTLVNTNKEYEQRLQQYEPMVQSAQALQQTFQEHGVRREQFDQGMQVIGMINRGDLASAQKVLEEQLRLISLATGKPIGIVDPLVDFPDLREQVDSLQLAEAQAIQLARARMGERSQQQAQQRQQQEQQVQQQTQQAVQGGQLAVDKFCKARMTTDLDYAKIEPLLLTQIQDGLLEGVPPARWAAIVEKTYNLIKQTASIPRSSTGAGVLRPTGAATAQQAPRSGFEAMWGKSAPAA